FAWPLGQQSGVVPSVAERGLVRSRRALNKKRTGAGDGSGKVLADPAFRRARHTVEQQRAIGRKRCDGDLDQPLVTDILRRDFEPVRQRSTEQVCLHGPRREQPVRWSLPVVNLGKCPEFFSELLFGMQPEMSIRFGERCTVVACCRFCCAFRHERLLPHWCVSKFYRPRGWQRIASVTESVTKSPVREQPGEIHIAAERHRKRRASPHGTSFPDQPEPARVLEESHRAP